MKSNFSRFALSVALVPLCHPGLVQAEITASAQNASTAVSAAPEDLGTIVLSALRVATERLRSGVSVSVVTAEDIAKDRSVTVADYLTRLPGVSLTHYGPFGNTAELRVRGLGSGYLTVMVDGIRVNDSSNPKNIFDFGSLLTADVGRIELLRGSQSALWGNSAVGGVITISTLEPSERQGFSQHLQAEAGSLGTGRLSYGLGWRDERAELALTATRFHTDGYSSARAGTEADGGDAARLSFSGRYRLNESLTLGGALFSQKTSQEYDDFQADAANEQTRRETGARLFTEIETGLSDHTLEVSLYDIDRDFRETFGNNGYRGRRLSLGWQAASEISSQLSLVYGLDHSEDRVSYIGGYGTLPAAQVRTRISGAFGQAIWAPAETLDLSASLRLDEDSNFGRFVTGRVAAAWQASEGLTLSASAARGYRAPTIDERFGDYSGSGWVIGNPDLKPEQSWSYELGAELASAGGSRISATLFRIDLDKRISPDFVPVPPTYQNASGASILQGLELSGAMPVSEAWALQGAYTYTDARGADGSRLSGVAWHTLALSAETQLSDNLSVLASMRHMSGWLDTFSGRAMPSFTLYTVQASYQLSEEAQAYLRVENIFDRDYEVSDGYGTPGRLIALGLESRF